MPTRNSTAPIDMNSSALEQDVGEGVGDRAVEGELGADADADDHEAELVVEAVGQHAPQVVLDHGIEDRKRGHRGADRHQNFGAGESARQRVDGDLGGERRQQHRAGDGRFRIGVLQPVVQQRERALDAEGEEDQRRRRAKRGRSRRKRASRSADSGSGHRRAAARPNRSGSRYSACRRDRRARCAPPRSGTPKRSQCLPRR